MSKIIIKSIPIITTSHAKMLRISSTAIQNLHCQCDLQHQGPDHLREVFYEEEEADGRGRAAGGGGPPGPGSTMTLPPRSGGD